MNHLKKSIWKILLLEMLIIFIVVLLMINICGARLSYFIDAFSLLFILLPSVPILLLSGMAKDFAAAFTIGKKEYSLLQMKKSLEAIKMFQGLILCGIGFSISVEFVTLLHNMSDLSSLGPNIAIIILSVFYGILFECMLIPLSAFVQNHIIDAMNTEDEE